MTRVANLEQAILGGSETDKPYVDAFQAELDKFANALEQPTRLENTPALQAADKALDNAYRALRHIVRANLLSTGTKKVQSATKFKNILDRYGDITQMPYNEQLGAASNLITDLSATSLATDTSAIGLSSYLETFVLQHAKFQSALELQTSEKAQYIKGLVYENRNLAEAAYRTFVKSINALVIINGEEAYKTLVDQVNVIVADAKALLKARATRGEDSPEEDITEAADYTADSEDGTTSSEHTLSEGETNAVATEDLTPTEESNEKESSEL